MILILWISKGNPSIVLLTTDLNFIKSTSIQVNNASQPERNI